MNEIVRQSFYIVADNQKIYRLVNNDNSRFEIEKVVDFSPHEIQKEITNARDRDWLHMFVSDKSLTFDGDTYNMDTFLKVSYTIPDDYFGEKFNPNNQTVILK